MTTQTQTGSYLKKMAHGGHFKQKLGETALALTECYCKADGGNRSRLGQLLRRELYTVLREVYGWAEKDAYAASMTLTKSFRETVNPGGEA